MGESFRLGRSVGPLLQSYGRADVGRARASNQDAIYIDNDGGVFVLADGMGGHRGGERASRLAVEVAGRLLSRRRARGVGLGPESAAALKNSRGAELLTRTAILKAHEVILKTSRSYPELSGLGSTIETLLIDRGTATIGHIGDSRVYLMRDGELKSLTEDHSMINEMVKSGGMTEEEAARHPFRNKITRALGHMPDTRVDVAGMEVRGGDLFIMCSDGLTNVLSDDRISARLARDDDDLEAACEGLIEMANEGGGPDNISVILVRVT